MTGAYENIARRMQIELFAKFNGPNLLCLGTVALITGQS